MRLNYLQAMDQVPILQIFNNKKGFFNRSLKIIAELIGLKKPLTSHIARHTFATTVVLANDVPIETLSKMLGHTKVSVTQVYAKILNSSVEKHAEKLNSII